MTPNSFSALILLYLPDFLLVILVVLAIFATAGAVRRFGAVFGRAKTGEQGLRFIGEFRTFWLFLIGAVVAVLAIVLAFERSLIARELFVQRVWSVGFSAALLFGGAVGAAELISRYRNDPYRAIRSPPAVTYILINALAAAAALYLLWVYRSKDAAWNPFLEGEDPTSRQMVGGVIIAGFAALAFFRTSIFKIKPGNADVEIAVGPAVVLDTLLWAADREVDRTMAAPRVETITGIMKDVAFARSAKALPALCFGLMQNVAEEESRRAITAIDDLEKNTGLHERVKAMTLGLILSRIVGTDVLRLAVDALPDVVVDPTRKLLAEVAAVLDDLDYSKCRRVLPIYCQVIAETEVTPQTEQLIAVQLEVINGLDVADEAKLLMLGTTLAKRLGGDTLRKAVTDLRQQLLEGKRTEPDLPPSSRPEDAMAGKATATPSNAAPGVARPDQEVPQPTTGEAGAPAPIGEPDAPPENLLTPPPPP